MAPALVLALLVTQLGGKTLAIDPGSSRIEFRVDHKLHKVVGHAGTVEAKAAIAEDGKVLAMVRVPVASLDSGDANRDANMREVLEAGEHPFVVFKGVGQLPSPQPRGTPFETTLNGELDLHGVKRPLDIPVVVQLADDGAVRVRGRASFSLESFRIERPSLLMIKLDDDCRIEADLLLREAAR
jgi:polyisoprenoid-binding protein YceI